MNNTQEMIATYLRAANACLYLVTHEEKRALEEIQGAVQLAGWRLHRWSLTSGIVGPGGVADPETKDPLKMLAGFDKLPTHREAQQGAVLVALDFHACLGGPHQPANPQLVRRIRESIERGREEARNLIIVGCRLVLPPELEKLITVIELELPDKAALEKLIDGYQDLPIEGAKADAINALTGMSLSEADNALALSLIEGRAIKPSILQREKCRQLSKTKLMTVVHTDTTLEDIGGLDRIKAHLHLIKDLFTPEARAYGLTTPKPLLCCGQAGSGKSMTARAMAAVFKLPLIRVSAGALFGSLVGETERNWRTVFKTLKGMAPVIGFIDEAEALFIGSESSGKTDGGTSARLGKQILEDVQENQEDGRDGIMFVFTANEIDAMPDPFIDRCDVWSFDLPTLAERRDIWRIHIARRRRDPRHFDLEQLAAGSAGYSGRQIEQAWLKAMQIAFADAHREPVNEDVLRALGSMVATSRTMGALIEARRARLKDRAQPASTVEAPVSKPRAVMIGNN